MPPSNISSLLKSYVATSNYSAIANLAKLIPVGGALSTQKVELVYAFCEIQQRLDQDHKLAIQINEKLAALLVSISDNSVQFTHVTANYNYFRLSYKLIEAITTTIATKDQFLSTEKTVLKVLNALKTSLDVTLSDDVEKLSSFLVLFGILFGLTQQIDFLVKATQYDQVSVYTELCEFVEDHTVLNSLESVIANCLVIPLSESRVDVKSSFGYNLLLSFNTMFYKERSSKQHLSKSSLSLSSTEFSALLFLKYAAFLRLRLILAIPRLPVTSGNRASSRISVIQAIVNLRSQELDARKSELAKPRSKLSLKSADSDNSLGLSEFSASSNVSYKLEISEKEHAFVKNMYQQCLSLLHVVQNGANFIIFSSPMRSRLAHETKALLLESFACLYFLKMVTIDSLVSDLLSKNLVTQYSESSPYTPLAEPFDGVDSETPSLASADHDFVDNNELSSPVLSPCIFGFLSLLSLDSEHKNIPALLSKKISFLIFNNPSIKFSVLKPSLHVIAVACKHLSQDIIVGLIYSLNNMLSIDEEESSKAFERKEVLSRSITGTLRAPRLTKSDISYGHDVNISAHERTDVSHSGVSSSSPATSIDKIYKIFDNSIKAIVQLCNTYNEPEITTLVLSVMFAKFKPIQENSASKIAEALNHLIIRNLYKVGNFLHGDSKNFQSLIKDYLTRLEYAIGNGNDKLVVDITTALSQLARNVKSAFYVVPKDLYGDYVAFPGEGKVRDQDKDVIDIEIKSRDKLHYNLNHPLVNQNYVFFLHELLNSIVTKGDNSSLDNTHHRSHVEISKIASTIAVYFAPLAALLPSPFERESSLVFESNGVIDDNSVSLFRNVWFNMVVHGMNINVISAVSPTAAAIPSLGKTLKGNHIHNRDSRQVRDLEIIAYNSPPLASKLSWSHNENLLELNTVLRRGSSNSNTRFQKALLEAVTEKHENEVKGLDKIVLDNEAQAGLRGKISSTPKLMFLSAAFFLESLRVQSGNVYKTLLYLSDPSIKMSGLEKDMRAIVIEILGCYTAKIHNSFNLTLDTDLSIVDRFTISQVAYQFNQMLILTCATNSFLQSIAVRCCDILLSKVPNILSHAESYSLFRLLDLLHLLFESIADYEKRRYNPVLQYTLPAYTQSPEKIILLDSLEWRQNTFGKLQTMAKEWITRSLEHSPQLTRSLLVRYVVSASRMSMPQSIHMGVSFAMSLCKGIAPTDKEAHSIAQSEYFKIPGSRSGKIDTALDMLAGYNIGVDLTRETLLETDSDLAVEKVPQSTTGVSHKMLMIDQLAVSALQDHPSGIGSKSPTEVVRELVRIPFETFDPVLMKHSISIWLAAASNSTKFQFTIFDEVLTQFRATVIDNLGLFAPTEASSLLVEYHEMQYAPSNKLETEHHAHAVSSSFKIHLMLVRLVASFFVSTLHQSPSLARTFKEFMIMVLRNFPKISGHPFSRLVRLELIKLALICHFTEPDQQFLQQILDALLDYFKYRKSYPVGDNLVKIKTDLGLLNEVSKLVSLTGSDKSNSISLKKTLALIFLEDEISSVSIWLSPLDTGSSLNPRQVTKEVLSRAYKLNPALACNIVTRLITKGINASGLQETLKELLKQDPLPAINYPDCIRYMDLSSPYIIYFDAASPIDSINLFSGPGSPHILQYAMKSLVSHDVYVTFFYVPQIVQMLRHDNQGYVQRFILETAQLSQLFAHQIIWNMLANSYKDDEGTIPDSLKPKLDEIRELMTASFTAEDLVYYEKEFGFFKEITGISAKLKPYVKKTKAEKKMKIDEEMRKIKLEPGVYLPCNPDGVLVDINRTSGRPLQSHAKAPFMATFKIKKDVVTYRGDEEEKTSVEVWKSAIFKVGDDCRQDVLALQLISVFRTIWANANLDLYVFPNRVTATDAGCGIIDVLPNSVSRDMLGREAVNKLYEYFITKFGPEYSTEFQIARNNLVKSLAAYSIISYLLQFKDRHNGNIMYDDQGHILHIDFGFCFDIVPGGVKFEAVPFKLTKEMVMVMGGSNETQSFKRFEELCVQGFLAARPYMDVIVNTVVPMLDSGLPCFKGMTTIKNLKARFVPQKSEREAALYMRKLIKKSYESFFTVGYDEFQKLTNGIPY